MALQNCGNDRVNYTSGGQLKRRKSRTHALDIPSGMQRNLSESHLVQAGSKAVSNVAEQFSKLGHSLNPKILTGKKTSAATPADEPVEKITVKVKHDDDESATEVCESSNKYNDTSFLKSVGIVMVDSSEMAETQNQSEPRKMNHNTNSENVARMSISSVTDYVKLPAQMLNNATAMPAINVQETEDGKGEKSNLKMCHSVADMRSSKECENGARFVITNFISQWNAV